MLKITLVSSQHYNNFRVSVIPQFCQPFFNISKIANSTPIVDFDSTENSFLVNLDRMFDLPTPESPIKTILNR
ncbi:unnamed protein product [Bathycoccus prasinos]